MPGAVKGLLNSAAPLAKDVQDAAKKATDALPDPHDIARLAEQTGKKGADLVKQVMDSAAKGASSLGNMVPIP